MPRGRPAPAKCANCRWWERIWNYKTESRDWGDCHFWGQSIRRAIPGGSMSTWEGPSPRGSDKCDAHNAEPVLIGKMDIAMQGPGRPYGNE